MTYHARWARIWSVLVALGVGVSFVVWHPVTGLVSLAAVTTFVALALMLLASTADGSPPRLALRGWGHLVALAVTAGSVVMAAVTVAVVFWPLALVLGGAAVASSPWVVRRAGDPARHRPTDGRPGTRVPTPSSPGVLPCVQALTNAELCAAWQRSFVVLAQVSDAQQRLAVVTARQAYLDEMERRSPTGFGAWLASDARAGGAPDRYLTGPDKTAGEAGAA